MSHPLQKDIDAVRTWIAGVDPSITEEEKWNAPSFKTTDFFATFHLRSQDTVQVVLHTGAKKKKTAKSGIALEDPAKLLKWLAPDRCMATLGAGKALRANRKAFEAIVREWIRWL